MKRTVTWWLAAIARNRIRSARMGLAGLAIIGAGTAGVVTAASASFEARADGGAATADPASDRATATPASPPAQPPRPAQAVAKKMPAAKQVPHSFKLQPNYYYCGPTSVRIALSAHGKIYSEDRIAQWLGTTTSGTNSAADITRVLNARLGKGRYHTTFIPGQRATAKQVAQLKVDVVTAINRGDLVVANVAGTFTDKQGEVHSYEGGHYLPVWGYLDNGNTVKIADEADAVGSSYYTMSIRDFANWIASRGYSS